MKKIVIGQIDLSFHKAAAGVFYHVLKHWGYEPEIVEAKHEEMFALQQSGKVDLLISAWLPGSHGKYLEPYKDRAILLNPIYEPYCVWAVPTYIPESLLLEVSDLSKPQVLAKMDKEINGIPMGAGISRFSVEMLDEYGLKALGYNFTSNKEADFFKIVEEKYEKGVYMIIPIWHPQYLHYSLKLRSLKEPKGLLRGKDQATPIFLKSSMDKIKNEELEALKRIYLGNDEVTEIDYLINKLGKSPKEAALQWIHKKGGIEAIIRQ